jgi:poly(beta-D-mannuronate) lyase
MMKKTGRSMLIAAITLLAAGKVFSFAGHEVGHRKVMVGSAREITRAMRSAAPGDTLVMRDQIWKDQQIQFEGDGTKAAPIVLKADTPGKVVLSGTSSLEIAGAYLVVDGLVFKNGHSRDDVISFKIGGKHAEHCRLTNTVIRDYNELGEKTDNKWVSLYGTHNRVDHCLIEGKTNPGTTMVVWLDGHANYDQIDHNYFGERPELGANGGETIRVGTSEWSQTDSYTTVEDNYFKKCDGEIEIISNKSCHNTYRHNTFQACRGTLTLRHGNYATVEGNTFLGEGEPESGGVRIIGAHHIVKDNYFQDLTGTGLRAAISVMNAQRNPALNGYWPVDSISVVDNTIVNCKEGVVMGSGAEEKGRVVAPDHCVLSNNKVYRSRSAVDRSRPIPAAVDPAQTGPVWLKTDA